MTWLSLETQQGSMPCEIGDRTTIGRATDASLIVRDPCASLTHCIVERRGATLWLRDGGSSNGTYVNGKLVRGEVELKHGDLIRIGDSVLRVLEQLTDSEHQSAVVLREAARTAPSSLDTFERTMVHVSAELAGQAPDPGPSIENGQLLVGRGGEMRVQLWNARIGEGGLFLRIPLAGDRPPSSFLHRYVGKGGKNEHLVLAPGDTAFEGLLAEAQWRTAALSERARVDYLMKLVHDTMGGLQSAERLKACLAWCEKRVNQPVPIGDFIVMGSGACRHRAFLFFHLARRIGLQVELCRGAVEDGRHAWNVVRVDGRRVFVDATYNVVLDDAREAERAYGYAPSRLDVSRPDDPPAEGRMWGVGEAGAAEVESFSFQHELRRVPGDEEALLLLYPERAMVRACQVHVRFHVGVRAASMFAMDPFVAARVYAIVGDEAHHRMDAVDPEAVEKIRRAWV